MFANWEEVFESFSEIEKFGTKMLFLPQDSLDRLHEPDYRRKDTFLIGIFLIIEQCMTMSSDVFFIKQLENVYEGNFSLFFSFPGN